MSIEAPEREDKVTVMQQPGGPSPVETSQFQPEYYDDKEIAVSPVKGIIDDEESEEPPAPKWPTAKDDEPELSCMRFIFILFEHPTACVMSKWVSAYVFFLILISSVASWIETIPSYAYPMTHLTHGTTEPMEALPAFEAINTFCMWNFLIEYMIRFIAVTGSDVDPWRDIELFYTTKMVPDDDGGEVEVTDFQNNDYAEYYHPQYNIDGIPMPAKTRLYQWSMQPLSIVDFLAVLPFVLDLLKLAQHLNGFVSLRYLRLIRVFRVLKLQKQTIAVALFVNTIRTSAGPLMVLMFFVAMAIVVFGSIVYQVEHGNYCPPGVATNTWLARGTMNGNKFVPSVNGDSGTQWVSQDSPMIPDQPGGMCTGEQCPKGRTTLEAGMCMVNGLLVETCCGAGVLNAVGDAIAPASGCFCRLDTMGDTAEPTPFFSVFVSMWWVLTTITTVGYGDTFPTTLMGRIVGSIAMILGVVGFAMPISIIGNAFEEEYNRLSDKARVLDQALGIGSEKIGDIGHLHDDVDVDGDSVVINGAHYVKRDDSFAAQPDSPGGAGGTKLNESSQRVQKIGSQTRDPIDVMTILADIAKDMGVSRVEWETSFQTNRV